MSCLLDRAYADHKVRRLRRMKFKLQQMSQLMNYFSKNAASLYFKNTIGELNVNNKELTVLDKKYKYDVNLEEDGHSSS